MGFTLHRGFESRPLRYEVCYGWLEPNTDELVCGGPGPAGWRCSGARSSAESPPGATG